MKKPLLLITVLASVTASYSQVTITSADGPQVNQVFVTHTDTTSSVGAGSNGPSMTWNFTTLNNHLQDSVAFSAVGGTPAASDFTTSNLCIADPIDSVWIYLTNNLSELTIDGYYFYDVFLGGWITIPISPPSVIIKYPSTYLSAYSDTAKLSLKFALNSPPVDSVWSKQTIFQSSNINAWGTLTTPSGSFNCLRQDYTDITLDSTFIHIFGSWSYSSRSFDTVPGARWWTTGTGYPVMEMAFDSTGAVSQTTYLFLSPVGVAESGDENNFVICYPNPSVNDVHFITNVGSTISITDAQGKLMQEVEVNEHTEKINTEAWPAGVYYYNVTGKKTKTLSGKILVTH